MILSHFKIGDPALPFPAGAGLLCADRAFVALARRTSLAP